MDFDAFIDQAWDRHADDPAGVAASVVRPGLDLARTEEQVLALAHLAQHVQGEHLAWWQAGIELQRQLAQLPAAPRAGSGAVRLLRYQRALAVCLADASGPDPWAGLDAGDRIAVAIGAAAHLVPHDMPRAEALLRQALAEAESAALPANDPALRMLAVGTNNLASTLEHAATRTPAQRALMITAAEAARHWWSVAGTWLETERADYRLAGVWLAAGDPARARTCAQACLDRVMAEGAGAPLERFHAWDALGRVARASGDAEGLQRARDEAGTTFQALSEADRGWCGAVLERLRAD